MLWMEKTLGEGTIRATYQGFEKARSLPAIDKAIDLRRKFLDFARHAWNQKPLDPSFVAWDKLPLVPERGSLPIPEEHLFLAGQKKRTANVPFGLSEVARDYRPFKITDEKVKEVIFRNPLASNPDARIGAILTFKGGTTRFDDWSGKKDVRFCRDTPGPGRRVARRRLRQLLDERGRRLHQRDADARPQGRVRGLPLVLQGQGRVARDGHQRLPGRQRRPHLRDHRRDADQRPADVQGRRHRSAVQHGADRRPGLRRLAQRQRVRGRAGQVDVERSTAATTCSTCRRCATRRSSARRFRTGRGPIGFSLRADSATRRERDALVDDARPGPRVLRRRRQRLQRLLDLEGRSSRRNRSSRSR